MSDRMAIFLSCIIGGCHGFIVSQAYRIGNRRVMAAAVVSYIAFIIYREVAK